MASDQGPVATEPSLQPSQHVHAAPAAQPTDPDGPESARANPLKRSREDSPGSPSPDTEEPSHKTTRFTPRTTSPIQLTAAVAALEAERRRREELGQELSNVHDQSSNSVLESLIRSNAAMSQPSDVHATPAPTATMEATERPENSVPTSISIPMSSDQLAPTGSSVLGANGDASQPGDPTLPGEPVTESPGPMDIDPHLEETDPSHQAEKTTPASHSYPGPLHMSGPMPAPASRNMSYPGQASPPSAGRERKEHKCPTCSTVFTRQHNLKSHMLTHKDEKPYKCEQCDMRFRRLHDLKRHSKLHTGEKPHVCPKCDRKFARGDALARHSKGAGGCAGRRSSMGTFLDDDANTSLTDADDSRMHDHRMASSLDGGRDSLHSSLYAKYAADAAIAEEERMRQQGLSGMKASQGVGSPANIDGASDHGQVYARSASGSGGLYPPDRNSVSALISLKSRSYGEIPIPPLNIRLLETVSIRIPLSVNNRI